MNNSEVKELWEALTKYRTEEEPCIYRTFHWKDFYLGTGVNYHIGEYNLVCKFWPLPSNKWEMSIYVVLHNDARMSLCDPIVFKENVGLEIPNQIDQMIAALKEMPPVIDVVRNRFKEIWGGTYD